jgi:hypothetical protein
MAELVNTHILSISFRPPELRTKWPEKPVSGDDIAQPQEQLRPQLGASLPDRLPQSQIEWLARINRRYLVLYQEKTNDTS